MQASIFERLSLICPVCRHISERGRELYTVSLADALRTEKLGSQDEVLDGILRCDNPLCQRQYPVIDGIPILVPDPSALIASQLAGLAELPTALTALLVRGGTDETPLAKLVEHLSIYLDAHYGDWAASAPDGPLADKSTSPGFGGEALFASLRERAKEPVAQAVELGCSVGRGLFELAQGAGLVVGVDLHLGALRAARRVLRGERLRYLRRMVGRHYTSVEIRPPATEKKGKRKAKPPTGEIVLVCGDALDPPLVPRDFERVVAHNLLDSVSWPPGLLSVVDGLCAPGGEVLMACPYAWQSGIVDEAGRLGGALPEQVLRNKFQRGDGLEAPYLILEDREIPWQLRRDLRSAHSYVLHALRMRKAAG